MKFMKESSPGTGEIVLYKDKSGQFIFDVKLYEETVWLNQKQIAALFRKDLRTINEHIQSIFNEGELLRKSTIRKFRIVRKEGKRMIERSIDYYNLDVIISVGYRVKSQEGTRFRIWATSTLKNHILQGFTLSQKRLQEKGLSEFEQAIALVKRAMQSKALTTDEAGGLLEVITGYAQTWILLRQYDENTLAEPQKTRKARYQLTYEEAMSAVHELKMTLVKKGEASGLFGRERESMLAGVLGNIYQTFGGEELYPSFEAKAAHLLYFIIKDHPFLDGNKRIGAFLFIVFLGRNHGLMRVSGEKKINDNALVALALLIAESDPAQKETLVALTMRLLR